MKLNINIGKDPLGKYLPYLITGAVFSIPTLTGGLAWLYFLTPLPVFYYLLTLENNKGVEVIAKSAIVAGLIAIFIGALYVQLFSFTLVPIGFILADSIKKRHSPFVAALKATFIIAATYVLLGMILSSVQHANLYSEILLHIDQSLALAFDNYQQTAKLDPAAAAEIESAFTSLRQLVPKIFPAIIMMTVISTVWMNLVAGDWLLKRKAQNLSPWDNFRFWRLPESLVWSVIIAGITLFAPGKILSAIGLNVLMVMSLVYFFQGLAVITFLFAKWAVPWPIKLFLYLMLVVQAYGMIILAALGITDVWLDFRKPGQDQENSDQ